MQQSENLRSEADIEMFQINLLMMFAADLKIITPEDYIKGLSMCLENRYEFYKENIPIAEPKRKFDYIG